ncbi:MAG: Hsp70 family protein, partial [archaeon]|nr:Hsp70 family protein [archaeon]
EDLTAHLIDATRDLIDELFTACGLTIDNIDEVLLCGGSTRLPQVSDHLRAYGFRNIVSHRDTDLAVAKGAAIVASLYSNDDNRIRDLVISDVNAHSLGALSIDPVSGSYRNEIMIPVNSRIPTSVTKPFRIEEGNLTDQIEIYMLQGESTVPSDCTVIKREVVTGFENNGKGMVVDITYSYDENGSVNVAATRNGRDLTVIHESVPEDLEWLRRLPKDRTSNKRVSKCIAICVDLSRSMEDSMEEVRSAISNFVMSLSGEFTKFTIIGFGDRAKVLLDLTTDEDEVLEMIGQLRPKKLGRGTDASPLPLVYETLKDEKGARMALILTDGKWGKRDDAVEGAKECKDDMINLVAVGFGDEVDRSFLKQIATLEEGAMYTTLNNLGKTINTIATAIIDSPTGLVEHFR